MSAILLHLIISFSLFSTTAPPASPPLPPLSTPTNCSTELLRFSVCLPHISSYPNNLTRLPSSQCCHEFDSAVTSATVVCLCYLIRQPLMLGFPLNATRLLSLATLCRVKDQGNQSRFSLDSFCSGSTILPPLRSMQGPEGHPEQHSFGGNGPDGPPKGPDNPAPPTRTSEATNNNTEASIPVPEPMTTPADDYFHFDSQHLSAANVVAQPRLSASFLKCCCKWSLFIPQIMTLVPHLSTYM